MLQNLLCTIAPGTTHQPAGRERPVLTPGPKYRAPVLKSSTPCPKCSTPDSKYSAPGPYSLPSQHTLIPGPDSVEAQALHYCIMNQTEKLPFLTLDPRHIVHFLHSVFAPNFMNELRLSLRASLRKNLTMRSYAAA